MGTGAKAAAVATAVGGKVEEKAEKAVTAAVGELGAKATVRARLGVHTTDRWRGSGLLAPSSILSLHTLAD